jgi:hypothetical protein
MSSSKEISPPSFEENDSGFEPESLGDLERGQGGRGKKSRPKKETKKDLKRKGTNQQPGKSHNPKATGKKRKTASASMPTASDSEQPPAEPTLPAAQKLSPLEQIGENLMASLLRRNIVTTDCSPSNKNLLECFTDAMKDSFLKIGGDETPSAGDSKSPFEHILEAVGENSITFNLDVCSDSLDTILDRLFAMVPSASKPPSGPA